MRARDLQLENKRALKKERVWVIRQIKKRIREAHKRGETFYEAEHDIDYDIWFHWDAVVTRYFELRGFRRRAGKWKALSWFVALR